MLPTDEDTLNKWKLSNIVCVATLLSNIVIDELKSESASYSGMGAGA